MNINFISILIYLIYIISVVKTTPLYTDSINYVFNWGILSIFGLVGCLYLNKLVYDRRDNG